MLCATLLPLAKSLDQLVQQNVDQVRHTHCCRVRINDEWLQAAARAVKESVASMGGARDAKAVMAAKQVAWQLPHARKKHAALTSLIADDEKHR